MRSFVVVAALTLVALNTACGSSNRLKAENRTSSTIFVFGTEGGLNETTGWEFIEAHDASNADFGGTEPEVIHVYFDHPRNSDGTPGRFEPGLRNFSCTWEEAKNAEPLVITDGDPPCGVVNVIPP